MMGGGDATEGLRNLILYATSDLKLRSIGGS